MKKALAFIVALIVFALLSQVLLFVFQIMVGFFLMAVDVPSSPRIVANVDSAINILTFIITALVAQRVYKMVVKKK